MALKGNMETYSNFWGINGIKIKKIYPENLEVCTFENYPNCGEIVIFLDETLIDSSFQPTGQAILTGKTIKGLPCEDGEQGIYADNYRDLEAGYYTGYRWKEYNGMCYAACGPSQTEAYICPTAPFGKSSESVETIGCFKGDWAVGRCVTNAPITGSWVESFSSESPTGDACVQNVEGRWFIPHGGENEMIWSKSDDPSLACKCGQDYAYDSSCHPAFCPIKDCCVFCFNGVKDCGEKEIDKGSVCDECVCDEDLNSTEEYSEITICFQGTTLFIKENLLANYEPYTLGICPKEDPLTQPSKTIFGTGVSNFVALCKKENIEGQINDKCELAKIIVYYGEN